MNKAQLVEAVQALLGEEATKKQAESAVTSVLEAIKKGIVEDGKVQLIGFGTFAKKTRAAREGRNPKTGAKMQIPASESVAFKGSSTLLEK